MDITLDTYMIAVIDGLLLLLNAALVAAAMIHARRIYDPIVVFLAFFFLVYVLRDFLLFTGLDVVYYEDLAGNDCLLRVEFKSLILFWLFGMHIALLFMPARERSALTSILPKTPQNISKNRLLVATLGLSLVVYLTYAYLFSLYGFNIGTISFAIRVEKLFAGYWFLLSLPSFAAYMSLAMMFYSFQNRQYATMVLWLINGLTMSMAYIFFGDRDSLMFVFVFLIMGVSFYIKKISFPVMAVFAVIFAYGLFLLADARLAMWGYVDPQNNSLGRAFSKGLNLQIYDNFLLQMHYFPDTARNGMDFLSGLFNIIPRSLWESKPMDTDPGIRLSQALLGPATAFGWPITPVGEWAINFGYFGPFIGGALIGVLLKLIQLRYRSYYVEPISFLFGWIIVTRFIGIGIGTNTPSVFVLTVIPLFLLSWFINRDNFRFKN